MLATIFHYRRGWKYIRISWFSPSRLRDCSTRIKGRGCTALFEPQEIQKRVFHGGPLFPTTAKSAGLLTPATAYIPRHPPPPVQHKRGGQMVNRGRQRVGKILGGRSCVRSLLEAPGLIADLRGLRAVRGGTRKGHSGIWE